MKHKFFLLIILLSFFLRFFSLDQALSFDEFTQTKAVVESNEFGLDKYTEMNPLTTWTRILVTDVFGVHVWVLRFVSLIFAVLTGVVLFLLAKELYGKNVAMFSVVLLSLSHLHFLVSTSISFDGAFLAFYSLLVLFFFIKYEKTSRLMWLVFCGIALGLSILTKYTGVLVLFAMIIYSLMKWRISRIISSFLTIIFVSLLVFSIFPFFAFLSGDFSYFWITLQHGINYFGGRSVDFLLLLMQYILAFVWIGSLLFFGYFMSFRKYDKKDLLFHVFILVVVLFYTFVVQDPFRPVERYFTVFLPLLCLLSGKYFASFKIERSMVNYLVVMLAMFMIMNLVVGFLPNKILPFYPKSNFINAIWSFDWNFLVPFTGDQGPVGLYVSFIIIFLAFLVCFVGFMLSFKNKIGSVILLSVGLAFSMFFILELSFSLTSPNISGVVQDSASFVQENDFPEPFYTFRDYAIQYYLGSNAINIDFTTDLSVVQDYVDKGGTFVVVDFPSIDKNSQFWKLINSCGLNKTFADKGINVSYIFVC